MVHDIFISMNELEKYYNKFNEDKRLLSRHGQVEFFVAMHYIHEMIGKNLILLILAQEREDILLHLQKKVITSQLLNL